MKNLVFSISAVILFCLAGSAQVPTTGLVGYWPFEGDANDMSGCIGHGSVDGAVLDTGIHYAIDGAYWFDGYNDKILCDDTFHLATRATLCVWVKFDDTTRTMVFMCKYNSNMDEGIMLGKISSGQVFCAGRNGNNQYLTTEFSKSHLDDDEWHFLVGVCDSNKWQIWVDGNLDNTVTYNHINYSIHSTSPVAFAHNPAGNLNFYEGSLDDARIYRRALIQSEIAALYYDGITGVQGHDIGICRVYPNPASQSIVFSDIHPESVLIYDQQGKLVISVENPLSEDIAIDINHLANGVYFIHAIEGEKVYHNKLLKE